MNAAPMLLRRYSSASLYSLSCFAALWLGGTTVVRAAEPNVELSEEVVEVTAEETTTDDQSDYTFTPQSGTIVVGDNLATIHVPESMSFYNTADARYLMETIYGNPPDESIIGMVVHEGAGEDDTGTVVVLSYNNDGHINDSDAQSVKYDELLTAMQEASRENSKEMVNQGYRSEALLGWAEAPHYDSQSKKIYWAKSYRFGNDPTPTLNYCIRILGRTGVLELNAIGATADLATIGPIAQSIMAVTELNPGNRYEDFKEGIDLEAAGGIAALVAGGAIMKKVGLLAIIGLGFLKFAKILIIPAIFLGGWIIKMLNGSNKDKSNDDDEPRRLRDR